jgi:hypothetical protein
MQVYIGSTLADLAEHRAKAIDALSRVSQPYAELQIVGPENAAIDGSQSMAAQLQLIADSSIYILLLGWRYGYIPEGETRSVVEIEYDAAKQSGDVMLCFIADDGAPVPGGLVETGDNAAALRRFKARVTSENLVRFFRSPDELAVEVVTSVNLWFSRPFSKVGQDVVDRPVLQQELQSLRRERDRHVSTISDLHARLTAIVPAAPIWHTRRFDVDDSLCFCLLPFHDDFMRVYEEAVSPAAVASGLRSLHAGQIFDNREIMEDIWESICVARVVVADVTNRNPNVFYELGICHTLGKEVIVITQQPEDVPFDIRHRRFIHYGPQKLASLRHDLQQTIQRVLVRNTDETPGA